MVVEAAGAGMSSSHAREVVFTCRLSQLRMQAVADMLLLSSECRPVYNDAVSAHGESYPKYRDTVVSKTRGVLLVTARLHTQLYSVTARWEDVALSVQELSDQVVVLAECCSHLAYLVAIHRPAAVPAVSGIIDVYKLKKANLDMELSCQRIKHALREQLTPPVLVQISVDISTNIGLLTEYCKSASDLAQQPADQDQFKHCIKSFTACAGALLSSIKCFKRQPTDIHHQRCINFCEPLLAATKGMVSFALEEPFVGKAAVLPADARDITKCILGASMSLVSASIQLCRVIKDLTYDNNNSQLREQIGKCAEAITKSSSQMDGLLTKYAPIDRTRPLSYYR